MKAFRPYSVVGTILCSLVVMALTLVFTASSWHSFFYTWLTSNVAIHSSIFLPIIFVSMWGATVGAFNRTLPAHVCRTNVITRIVMPRLLPIFLGTAVGWILGILPLVIITARNATWGSLNIGTIAVNLLALFLFILAGYVWGVRVPFPLSPLCAGAASLLWIYLCYILTQTRGSSFFSVTPVWLHFHFAPTAVRSTLNLITTTAFFLIIIVCLFWILSSRRYLPLLIVPVVTAAVIVHFQPALVVTPSVQAECTDDHGTNVCLHPAYRTARPAYTKALATLRTVVPAQAFPKSIGDKGQTVSIPPSENLPLDLNSATITQTTAQWMAGVWACTQKHSPGSGDTSPMSEQENILQSLDFALFNSVFGELPGISTFDSTFVTENSDLETTVNSALDAIKNTPREKLADFIAHHGEQLRTCDVSLLQPLGVQLP